MENVKHICAAEQYNIGMREMEIFRRNMKRLRLERGWTWDELGRRAGVTRQMLQSVAAEKNEITVLRAAMVAHAFGLSLDQMICESTGSDSYERDELNHFFDNADSAGRQVILSVARQFGSHQERD